MRVRGGCCFGGEEGSKKVPGRSEDDRRTIGGRSEDGSREGHALNSAASLLPLMQSSAPRETAGPKTRTLPRCTLHPSSKLRTEDASPTATHSPVASVVDSFLGVAEMGKRHSSRQRGALPATGRQLYSPTGPRNAACPSPQPRGKSQSGNQTVGRRRESSTARRPQW